MDQVKSAGNSWVDAASLAGATKNGVAESVTQFATAVISMTSSAGGELVVERGRTSATLTEVQVVTLAAAVKKTVTVLACETFLRVSLRNNTAGATVSSVETFYYDQLFKLNADDAASVSVTSSALPTGAATETGVQGIISAVQALPTYSTGGASDRLVVQQAVGRLPTATILWDAVGVGAGSTGYSSSVDTAYINGPITLFGMLSNQSNMTLQPQVSTDGNAWFTEPSAIYVDANGNWFRTMTIGARYLRLELVNADASATTVTGHASLKYDSVS